MVMQEYNSNYPDQHQYVKIEVALYPLNPILLGVMKVKLNRDVDFTTL